MNPRLIARKLRVLYDALDPAAEKAAREHPEKVSCHDGCHGCCFQMVGITIPEGLLLAKAMLERDDWEARALRMREACEPLLGTITRKAYFRRRIPCAFLDDGRCSVYAERPAACRFHYIVSPAADCYPESGEKGTRALNMIRFEKHVWDLNAETMGRAAAAGAPIQLTVLWCMWLLAQGTEREKRLEEIKAGVPDPNAWTLRALEGGVPDLAENRTREEVAAVRALLRER